MIRPWHEVEAELRAKGLSEEDILEIKQLYWEDTSQLADATPDELEVERRKFFGEKPRAGDLVSKALRVGASVYPQAAAGVADLLVRRTPGGMIYSKLREHLGEQRPDIEEKALDPERYFRKKAEEIAMSGPQVEPEGLGQKVLFGATAGAAQLPAFAAATKAAGPVGGFAVLEAALRAGEEEDVSDIDIAKAGAKGAVLGKLFQAAGKIPPALGLEGASARRAVHAGAVGTLFGGEAAVEPLLSGETPTVEDVASQAMVGVLLGMMSKGEPIVAERLATKWNIGVEEVNRNIAVAKEQAGAARDVQGARPQIGSILAGMARESSGQQGLAMRARLAAEGYTKPYLEDYLRRGARAEKDRSEAEVKQRLEALHQQLLAERAEVLSGGYKPKPLAGVANVLKDEALSPAEKIQKIRDQVQYERRQKVEQLPEGVAGMAERVAAPEMAPAEGARPISGYDVVKRVSEIFDTPIRSKGVPRGWKGAFYNLVGKISPNVARTKDLADVGVALHEMSHRVNRALRGEIGETGEKLPQQVRRELESRARSEMPGMEEPAVGWAAEGMAHFLSDAMWTGRPPADSPAASRWFNDMMSRYPEISGQVKQVSEVVTQYRQQTPVQEMVASIADPSRAPIKMSALPALFYQKGVEAGNPLRQAVMEAGEADNPANAYKIYRYFRGATGAMTRAAVKYGIINPNKGAEPVTKGFDQILSEVGIPGANRQTFKEFLAYLSSFRITEMQKEGIKFGRYGEIAPEAKAALEVAHPEWRQAVADFNKFGNELINMLVDEGSISAKRGEEMKRGEGWTPLQRVIEDAPLGKDVFKPLRGGSGQKILDPLIGMVNTAERAFNIMAHTKLMKSLLDMAERHEGGGSIAFRLPEPIRVGKRYVRYNDERHAITFMENGSPVSVEVRPDIYKVLKRSEPFRIQSRGLDLLFGGPKRMATLGYTGLNVGFQVISNPFRDSFTKALQTEAISDVPWYKAPVKGAVSFKETAQAAWEILGVKALGHEPSPSLKRFYASGSRIAGPLGADVRSITALRDSMIMSKWKYLINHPIDGMRELLSWSEDINRYPEFKMMEKRYGEDVWNMMIEGQVAASDVTLDFRRMGEYSRVLNEFIPFFNASIQGADKFARTMGRDPLAATMNAFTMISAPMLALWMVNKDEKWYQEIPTWEKTIFAHFKIGNKVLRLPLPFEWGIFFGSLPVAILDADYQNSPQRLKDFVNQARKSLFPDMIPQTIKPLIEAGTNRDFFRDRPIESGAMERLLPADRFHKHTPEVYKILSRATGGSVSPLKIQHVAEGYTGGMIRDVANIENIPEMAMKGDPTQAPILSRLFSQTEHRTGQSVTDFYRQVKEADQAWGSAKSYMKRGDRDGAVKILSQYKTLLGLTDGQIVMMKYQGEWKTPKRVLELHRIAQNMSRLRKEDEPGKMTDLAREALGR